jgi:hypothetical protein
MIMPPLDGNSAGALPAACGLHGPPATIVCIPRKQWDVALSLMIPLGMVMLDIFAQRPPQRALAEQKIAAFRANVCFTTAWTSGNTGRPSRRRPSYFEAQARTCCHRILRAT